MNYKDLYNDLLKELLDYKWLEKENISFDLINDYIKSELFINSIKKVMEEKDYSCGRILNLCGDLMRQISFGNLPENMLSYLYQYTLNKSFPEAVSIDLKDSLNAASELYLKVLKVFCEAQKFTKDGSWQSKFPLILLKDEENEEYRKFTEAFNNDYIYELMKLSSEVYNFNTLDHICGVHFLSMFIAKQVKELGIPIDLGRVSGAAAGHDIGKFGCKTSALKRVPYLHYYYTDQWFKRHNINYIRNIAINHSIWDLELENLSVESLILIYSDFRVKNKNYGDKIKMCIFTLEESFKVILEKLDNMNESKEKRYRKIYGKLKDFEDFLIDAGIETNPWGLVTFSKKSIKKEKAYSLMEGEDIVRNMKFLAIDHNINLMYKFRDEYSLSSLLDLARSEKDWRNLREYIRIIEEYSTYLTQGQKLQAIDFLYDNLIHPEDDIRRHCAELIGILIASFDEDYRKEIPENEFLEPPLIISKDILDKYINLLLYPKKNTISPYRFYLNYNMSILINSLFKFCRDNYIQKYRNVVLKYYDENQAKSIDSQIFLLETAKYIPIEPYDESLKCLFDFILSMLKKHNSSIRLESLEVSYYLLSLLPEDCYFRNEIKKYLELNNKKSSICSENAIKYKITELLKLNNLSYIFKQYCNLDKKNISQVFLSNLKTTTDWIKKKNQITYLIDYSLKNIDTTGIHTAIHFCNLLKVSAVEKVRNMAGESVLRLMPKLNFAERNEVSVELLRALEIEGNKFTEYIPYYAGQIILYLQPIELDEVIEDFKTKVRSSSSNIKSLILKTTGTAISNYTSYINRFSEDLQNYNKRLLSMLGVLLCGLGDYNLSVKQTAFAVICKEIFGTKNLNYDEKRNIFVLIGKKMLTMISDNNKDEELSFLINSAALNHIYRFISDYTFLCGSLVIPKAEKVAFFPGTFDPFSLSHKEIAKLIRDMGFEVYLSIDEFSWSKKTLPSLLRRNIINMSISDELQIFVYPQNEPINIANHNDLNNLKSKFKDSELYLALGSDVILNASAYKEADKNFDIFKFNHIIFKRGKNINLEKILKKIRGKVRLISLPPKYSYISSTQIRNFIDKHRDISSLIDPIAQQYIYENGFYQREPQEKSFINSPWLSIEIVEQLDEDITDDIKGLLPTNGQIITDNIINTLNKPFGKLLLLKDVLSNGKVIGFSLFCSISSDMLYKELKDETLCHFVRKESLGKIILINAMVADQSEKYKNLEQVLITETLAFCISKDFTYCIFKNSFSSLYSKPITELLKLHGFKSAPSEDMYNDILVVHMNKPCILNLDIENIIKEPFRSNFKIYSTISSSRKLLQDSLTKLYPGNLILSINTEMLHQLLIKKICLENKVSAEISLSNMLGNSMCVPYGDILDRYIIPNTITKALHTEKYFYSDLKNFNIMELPHYLNLESQVKVIKSFNKPIILVDNLLHKGYRMKALDPLLRKEDICVQKILCGILSGRGKDLMDIQGREVDSVYFIPNLNLWFNENSLYPFIGGDSLWRGNYPRRNLLPSINLIFPYTNPKFIKGASLESIYMLSKVSIENSLKILSVIESEYHILQGKKLNLLNLGEVFTIPRCCDRGKNMHYELNLSPSHYLENDLEILIRFKDMFDNFNERS